MAVAAAANRPGVSSDPRGQLRADKQAELRRRQAPGFSVGNLPGVNRARAAMLGLSMLNAAPTFSNDLNSNEATATNQSYSRDEAYRRTFQANKIKRQIGESAGLNLERRASSEESNFLADIEQDTAAREAEALERNQAGLDTRSRSAKSNSLQDLQDKGFQAGVQAVQDKFGKELGALGINLVGDTVEGFDWGEDFGLSDGIVFVQRQAQAVRTILSPEQAKTGTPKNFKELRANLENSALDLFVPRFDLKSLKGISGLLGEIWIWFVGGLILLVIAFFIALLYGMFSMWQNPFSTLMQIYNVGGASAAAAAINAAGNAALDQAHQNMTQ